MIHYPAYKVAAAHVAPVFLDTDRSVDKACSIIEEAADQGARLIAFPEVFLPGFPVWAGVAAPTHKGNNNNEIMLLLALNFAALAQQPAATMVGHTHRRDVPGVANSNKHRPKPNLRSSPATKTQTTTKVQTRPQ